MAQADLVDTASTKGEAEMLSKEFGIKGQSILSEIDSLSFPQSFPFDFMHVAWENVMNTLITPGAATTKVWTKGSTNTASTRRPGRRSVLAAQPQVQPSHQHLGHRSRTSSRKGPSCRLICGLSGRSSSHRSCYGIPSRSQNATSTSLTSSTSSAFVCSTIFPLQMWMQSEPVSLIGLMDTAGGSGLQSQTLQCTDTQKNILSGKPETTPGLHTPHPHASSPCRLYRGLGACVVLLVVPDGAVLRTPQGWRQERAVPVQELGPLSHRMDNFVAPGGCPQCP